MSKILIETIPHTGTRFVAQLFYQLGLVETTLNELQKLSSENNYTIKHFPTTDSNDTSFAPRVTVLRDPCLVAISNMRGHLFQESIGMDIKQLNKRYNVFVRRATRRKYVCVDIECPVEKRESHLVAVLKQLKLYNDSYRSTIKQYAEQWVPVGELNNSWKRLYLETGELPDCIRYCDLQRAIVWNEKLKQECMYDYIA